MTEKQDAVEKKLDYLCERVESLDDAIRGNGRIGLLMRVDRLEIVEKNRSRLLWVIAVSVLTLVVGSAWKMLGDLVVKG